jgi:hypothetical protein
LATARVASATALVGIENRGQPQIRVSACPDVFREGRFAFYRVADPRVAGLVLLARGLPLTTPRRWRPACGSALP